MGHHGRMLVHLRLVAPPDLADEVTGILLRDPHTTNVTRARDASLRPRGDLIGADVARESADRLLDELAATGLCDRGGMSVTDVAGTLFTEAERIEREAAGAADDSVIWRMVRAEAESMVEPSASYLTFLTLATALASVAVITDSPILVVGAMVVGPDFGPVGAMCAGIALRDLRLVRRALWLLVRGFLLAIAIVTVVALLGRLLGVVDAQMVTRERPMTAFIYRPDLWSFVVALLAGAAGTLAMTADKSNTMVGVFISVTTVPAAGNLALALAVLDRGEVVGSLAQLGVNLVGMVVAGTATMLLQQLVLRRQTGGHA